MIEAQTQTGKRTDAHMDRQTHKTPKTVTDTQTDRCTDRQENRCTDSQRDMQDSDRYTDRQVDGLNERSLLKHESSSALTGNL